MDEQLDCIISVKAFKQISIGENAFNIYTLKESHLIDENQYLLISHQILSSRNDIDFNLWVMWGEII